MALSTCVTMLVPAERRDKANGLVGTSPASRSPSPRCSAASSSACSAWAGRSAIITLTVAALPTSVRSASTSPTRPRRRRGASKVDVRGRRRRDQGGARPRHADRPGGLQQPARGVFMALMDAYGLELVSVEAWGFLCGLHQPRLHRRRARGRRAAGSASTAAADRPRQPRQLGGLLRRSPCGRRSCCSRSAWSSGWRLMPTIEAGRADRAPAVDPLRAPGPGVRLRAAGRERRGADHRVRDRAAGRGGLHAVHDRRRAAPTPSAAGSAPGPTAGIALMFTVAGIIGVVVTALTWRSRSYKELSAQLDKRTAATEDAEPDDRTATDTVSPTS